MTKRRFFRGPVAFIVLVGLAGLSGGTFGAHAATLERVGESRIELNGTWQFRLDPNEEGVAGRWFEGSVAFPDKIAVPGTWQAEGFGPSDGHLRHNYQGKAWYRRTVTVPANWAGKRIWLCFGGITNRADVFVNGVLVGRSDSSTVPWEVDATDAVRVGVENSIACLVDSTGPASRGLVNYVCRWGGLYRGVRLEARSDPAVSDVFVMPDVKNQAAHVQVTVSRHGSGPEWNGELLVRILPVAGGNAVEGRTKVSIAEGQQTSEAKCVDVSIARMRLWSPEDPFLYGVEVSVVSDGKSIDMVRERFGMRQMEATADGQLLLNGRPYFIRGIGDDTVEVIHGMQYPDKQIYLDRLKAIKRYGFNGVRFLGNTPIPEYFEAADEVGVLILAEGHEYGSPPETIPQLRMDVSRIVKTFRNHPSWYAWSSGNELFCCQGAAASEPWMAYVLFAHDEFKKCDPTRFFIGSEGADVFPTDIITQYQRFDGVRHIADLTQPFDGLCDELAYFKRALSDQEIGRAASKTPEANASYAESIRGMRPSGYWRFEEMAPGGATDASGEGHDGIYDSTMTAADLGRPGFSGPGSASRALHTDATRRGIRLKEAAVAAFAGGNDPFSVSFWIKPAPFKPGQYGTPFSYGTASTGAGLVIATDGSTGKLLIGQYGNTVVCSQAAIAADEWQHVGIVFDGDVMKVFINGKLDNSAKAKMATVLADARIGRCIANEQPVTDAMYRERPQIWHEFPNSYLGPLPDATADTKWTGVYQDPGCVSNIRKQLASLGIADRYPAIRERSLRLFREYLKLQFETARQSATMDGYHYWCLTDYPAGPEGEMTTYGLCNTVYMPDKFEAPEPMLRFNRETVLLIGGSPADRVLEAGTKKEVSLLISHYGEAPIEGGRVSWTFGSGEEVVQQGTWESLGAKVGEVKSLGAVTIEPPTCKAARKYRLSVRLESHVCRQDNEWEFWAFPSSADGPAGKAISNRTGLKALDGRYGIDAARGAELVVANRATPDVLKALAEGRSVLLLAEEGVLRPSGKFPFWPEWIRTSGTVIEDHPAVARFPHDGFCGFQFYRLFEPSLETVPMTEKGSIGREKLTPVVWGLCQNHDPSLGTEWFVPKNRWKMYRHGLVCEGRVGHGKVLICTLRVARGISAGLPEAGYLLDVLVDYALSDRFAPALPAMTLAEFRELVLPSEPPAP